MIKSVIFDYDGTLTKTEKGSTSWGRIWKKIDAEDVDYKLYKMHKNKEITDQEWLDLILEEFKIRGVNKQTFKDLADETQLIDELSEVFQILNKNNIKIIILSAGIKNIIDEKLKSVSHLIYKTYGYEFELDENGVVSHVDYNRKVDYKHEAMQEIMQNENLSSNEILYVGNGANDETIYQTGVKTLCLNADDADSSNKTFWNFVVNSQSLKAILSYLEIEDEKSCKIF